MILHLTTVLPGYATCWKKAADAPVQFGEVLQKKATFRDLIYEYLDYNDKQWSKLGIDILLGSRLDVKMKPREVMFLPDYLMKTFDRTTIRQQAVGIMKNIVIFNSLLSSQEINVFGHIRFLFSPAFFY